MGRYWNDGRWGGQRGGTATRQRGQTRARTRRALDTAVKRINRETYRKLEEFGYWKDGVMLKEFPTPNAGVVEGLIERYNQRKETEK